MRQERRDACLETYTLQSVSNLQKGWEVDEVKARLH